MKSDLLNAYLFVTLGAAFGSIKIASRLNHGWFSGVYT